MRVHGLVVCLAGTMCDADQQSVAPFPPRSVWSKKLKEAEDLLVLENGEADEGKKEGEEA